MIETRASTREYSSLVTLTDAQIKALSTTGIVLVRAPGAGYWVNPSAITILKRSGAGAYTNIDPTYCGLVVNWVDYTGPWAGGGMPNDSTVSLTLATDFLGQAEDRIVRLPIPYLDAVESGGVAGTRTWTAVGPTLSLPYPIIVNNTALVLTIDNNGAGNLTGGNAANSMAVKVRYTLDVTP